MKNWKLAAATLLSLALLLSFVGGYAETEEGLPSVEDYYGVWTLAYIEAGGSRENNQQGTIYSLESQGIEPDARLLILEKDNLITVTESIYRELLIGEITIESTENENALVAYFQDGSQERLVIFGDQLILDTTDQIHIHFEKKDLTEEETAALIAEKSAEAGAAQQEETGSAEPAASDDPAGAVHTDKETVKAVQQALNDAGFECGTPDGVAGKKTKKAITDYQTDKGLTVTGTVTDELLASLGIN